MEKNSSLLQDKPISMLWNSNWNVSVRETGIMIQPLLYWLAASPDGLITDENGVPYLNWLKLNALLPNVIYTHKICLKIRIFMWNYRMEYHT